MRIRDALLQDSRRADYHKRTASRLGGPGKNGIAPRRVQVEVIHHLLGAAKATAAQPSEEFLRPVPDEQSAEHH